MCVIYIICTYTNCADYARQKLTPKPRVFFKGCQGYQLYCRVILHFSFAALFFWFSPPKTRGCGIKCDRHMCQDQVKMWGRREAREKVDYKVLNTISIKQVKGFPKKAPVSQNWIIFQIYSEMIGKVKWLKISTLSTFYVFWNCESFMWRPVYIGWKNRPQKNVCIIRVVASLWITHFLQLHPK